MADNLGNSALSTFNSAEAKMEVNVEIKNDLVSREGVQLQNNFDLSNKQDVPFEEIAVGSAKQDVVLGIANQETSKTEVNLDTNVSLASRDSFAVSLSTEVGKDTKNSFSINNVGISTKKEI